MPTFYKYIILFFILVPIIILNLYNWQSTYIAFIFGGFYLFLMSDLLREKLISSWPKYFGYIFSVLIIFSIISSVGTLFYYIWKFDLAVISLILIFFPLILFILDRYIPNRTKSQIPLSIKKPKQKITFSVAILSIFYLILIAINFYLLFTSQVTSSIRSPWEVLPSHFFLIYFVSTVILITIIFKNRKHSL